MTSMTALDASRIAVKSFDPVNSRLMRLQHDSTEGRDALTKAHNTYNVWLRVINISILTTHAFLNFTVYNFKVTSLWIFVHKDRCRTSKAP